MKIAVHRNLTTGQWVVSSVKQTRNGLRKDKRLRTTGTVSLTSVSFVTCSDKSITRIQSNILDKTVSSGREVVAYAIGDICSDCAPMVRGKVSWNPLKGKDFYRVDSGEVVTNNTFDYACFGDNGMWTS